MIYTGMFDGHRPLKTKQWLQQIDAESRRIFARIGYAECGEKHGYDFLPVLGGKIRSQRALRDGKGRFK